MNSNSTRITYGLLYSKLKEIVALPFSRRDGFAKGRVSRYNDYSNRASALYLFLKG